MKAPSSSRDALRMVFGLLWAETDRYAKTQLAVSLFLVIVSASLAAIIPIAYKLLIDGFSGVPPVHPLLIPGLLVGVYAAGQYAIRVTGELRGLFHSQGTQRLERRLSRRMFNHIIRLPLQYHLDKQTGAIGETLGQGLSGCHIILQHFVFTFLPIAVEFLAIILVLIHFNHAAYLIIFGVAATAYVFAFYHGAVSITQPSEDLSKAHIEAHAVLTDSLLNYETVKYFNAERNITENYDGALTDKETAWRKFTRLRTKNGVIVATIFGISMGTSLGLAGHEVINHTMSIGDFVLINSYMLRLVQPLETIGFAVRDISQGLAFLQKMLELFREKPEGALSGNKGGGVGGMTTSPACASPHSSSPALGGGSVVFDDVWFSYREDRQILKGVSFSVPAGKTVAIVGISGSGKSSLIRLLFRLYDPNRGRILLDGVSIQDMPLESLRNAIAVVPQDTMLFNDTIGKNIGFGHLGAGQDEIEKAARLAHLHTFIHSLPEGYDTKVGERGLKLSGGEKQRVAIARAAMKKPRIFVFDEATSSLDSRTEKEILHNLIEVSKTSTTLVIAHRLSTVIHADEIIVLNQGTIVERGTHASLLQHNGNYAALWHAQQQSSKKTEPTQAA